MVSFTTILSVAAFAATSLFEPAMASGGFNFSPSVKVFRRADSPSLEFGACQEAASTVSPKPTYIIYSNRTVDINGLPAICISQLNTHNAGENVAQSNKWEGWGLVLNETAIQTSGVGNGLTAFLESVAVNIS